MIRMFNYNGQWIAGELKNGKLLNPKLYFFTAQAHVFTSFPGRPKEIPFSDELAKITLGYILPEGDLLDYYLDKPQKEPSILMPESKIIRPN